MLNPFDDSHCRGGKDLMRKSGLGLRYTRASVEGAMRRLYTLDELLSQCDPNAPFPEEIKAWEQADSVGEEWGRDAGA